MGRVNVGTESHVFADGYSYREVPVAPETPVGSNAEQISAWHGVPAINHKRDGRVSAPGGGGALAKAFRNN